MTLGTSQIRPDSLQHAAAGLLVACADADKALCRVLLVPSLQARYTFKGLHPEWVSGC